MDNIEKHRAYKRKYMREWYQRDGNREKSIARSVRYLKLHPDKKKEQDIRYRTKHVRELWACQTFYTHKKKGNVFKFDRRILIDMANSTDTCAMCGSLLDWRKKNRSGPLKNSPTLDRINNKNVLTENSIQIVCHQCNASKRSRTMKELVDWCKIIISKFGKEF